MNCSFDKNSQTGYLQNFGNLFGLCPNLLGNGICEHKNGEKKAKHHDNPALTTSSMSSIFSSISSNLHIMLSSSIPQRSFVKDIPSLNAHKDLMPFVESRAKLVQRGDPVAINAKLKEVLMPFIPTENFQQVGSCSGQCLGMQDRDFKPSQCESESPRVCEEPLDSIGNSAAKCDESDDDDEMDVDDNEEDVIFVRDMDCDDENDDDGKQEEDGEGGYDDDDEEDEEDDDDEEEDDDDDCSDWDEIDGQYSSACMAAIHDSAVTSDLSFATDEIVMNWDSGIDEEIMKIPKVPKILFEFEFSMESDDELEKEFLIEANEKWNEFYCCHFIRKDETGKVSKKVSFACDDDLLTYHQWDDCEGSRCGPWQQHAVDRERFKRKIKDSEELLSKVLQPEHRAKMFSVVVAGCTFADK